MKYFTGDDWDINVTLKLNGVVYDASGATIKAALIRYIQGVPTQTIADTTMSSGATGADWTNGIIVLEFPAASTATVDFYTRYDVEIQADKGGKKKSWLLEDENAINVVQGTIS